MTAPVPMLVLGTGEEIPLLPDQAQRIAQVLQGDQFAERAEKAEKELQASHLREQRLREALEAIRGYDLSPRESHDVAALALTEDKPPEFPSTEAVA